MSGISAPLIRRKANGLTAGSFRIITLLVAACCCVLRGRAADLADLYGTLSGKTVLMRSGLPVAGGTIPELPTDKSSAVAQIEAELDKRGLGLVQDGPDFVIIVPNQEARSLTNDTRLRGAELAAANSQKEVTTGAINLGNVSVLDVLPLYSDLAKRTVLRSATLPGVVRLKTACPLTRVEAVYAMETVFALNGIALVPDGEKFVQAVPMVQRSMVVTAAPKPEPGAQLLDPGKLPSVGGSDQPRPTSQLERDIEKYRKALYEFIHYKGPKERPAQRLLELYAKVAGKSTVSSTNFDRVPVQFHIQTPVTRGELMYAIEKTFSMSWIGITNIDETHIGLERLREWGPGIHREAPAQSIPELVSQLSHANTGNRFSAGMALTRLGTNAAPAVPAIGRLLATDPQKFHDVMLKVVENCPSAGQSIKPVLQTCLTNPNVNLRICCARTLWVLDNSYADMVRPVAKNCLSEADAGARIEAASLLWRMDKDVKEVVPTLSALLSDSNTGYDFRTIKLLGQIGPPAKEAVPALKTWLESERSHQAFITNAAVQALQSIGGGR